MTFAVVEMGIIFLEFYESAPPVLLHQLQRGLGGGSMSETVLVVEDDAQSVQLVKLILTAGGYEVLIAKTGSEGVEKARAHLPDLIVLDLMLSDISGFEVLRQVRSDPLLEHIPVVIVSARAQVTDKQTADELGVDAYLTKPFHRSDLIETMGSLL